MQVHQSIFGMITNLNNVLNPIESASLVGYNLIERLGDRMGLSITNGKSTPPINRGWVLF